MVPDPSACLRVEGWWERLMKGKAAPGRTPLDRGILDDRRAVSVSF